MEQELMIYIFKGFLLAALFGILFAIVMRIWDKIKGEDE